MQGQKHAGIIPQEMRSVKPEVASQIDHLQRMSPIGGIVGTPQCMSWELHHSSCSGHAWCAHPWEGVESSWQLQIDPPHPRTKVQRVTGNLGDAAWNQEGGRSRNAKRRGGSGPKTWRSPTRTEKLIVSGRKSCLFLVVPTFLTCPCFWKKIYFCLLLQSRLFDNQWRKIFAAHDATFYV